MPDLNLGASTPPLVFVGPSIPADEVRALLPGAEIRPPVQRGDLHLARMLRYSVFVLLDGVFSQDQAVSPREVVDVLRDGAAVVGGASMGALRAVDCAPAGAIGAGHLYRMFRRGLIDSEDEVAVTFNPARPYPSLTLALGGARLTLRRAVRQGLLSAAEAEQLITACAGLHYSQRTWPRVFDRAGLPCPPTLKSWLETQDPKREDARRVLQLVARSQTRDPGWATRPRVTRQPFPDHDSLRSRPVQLALGQDASLTGAGFFLWMLLSGRANRWLDQNALSLLNNLIPAPESDWPARLTELDWNDLRCGDPAATRAVSAELVDLIRESGDSEAEQFRFKIVSHAIQSSRHGVVDIAFERLTQYQMARAHKMADWGGLLLSSSPAVGDHLTSLARNWARAKSAFGLRGYERGGNDRHKHVFRSDA